MANIKLGTDTLTGVSKVKLQNADADRQYVEFSLSIPTQEKTVDLTTMDVTNITPDTGYTLSKVAVTPKAPLADTQEELKEKQSYLDSTDYQVVKKMEGLLTDDEFAPVKVARQEARDAINAARARIAELDTTIKEKEAEVKATIYGKRKYTYHNAFEGKTRAVLDYEEPSAD